MISRHQISTLSCAFFLLITFHNLSYRHRWIKVEERKKSKFKLIIALLCIVCLYALPLYINYVSTLKNTTDNFSRKSPKNKYEHVKKLFSLMNLWQQNMIFITNVNNKGKFFVFVSMLWPIFEWEKCKEKLEQQTSKNRQQILA
jgi:ABC-type glycerol-3-phosphate transport system permease component